MHFQCASFSKLMVSLFLFLASFSHDREYLCCNFNSHFLPWRPLESHTMQQNSPCHVAIKRHPGVAQAFHHGTALASVSVSVVGDAGAVADGQLLCDAAAVLELRGPCISETQSSHISCADRGTAAMWGEKPPSSTPFLASTPSIRSVDRHGANVVFSHN